MNPDDNNERRHNQDERRYKQFVIPTSIIYSLLKRNSCEPLQLPTLENLTDWKILNIDFSSTRYAFIVTIYHQSFASIPLGDELPYIPVTLKLFTVEPFPPAIATLPVPLNPTAVNPAFIPLSTKRQKYDVPF